jgi:hypothetical protein
MVLLVLLILPALAFAAAAIALFRTLHKMQISMGLGVTLSRYESPVLFWLVVALQGLAFVTATAIILAVCLYEPRFDLTKWPATMFDCVEGCDA